MKTIALFSLNALLLGACVNFDGRAVKGNGIIITKMEDVQAYHKVDLSGSFDIYLTQGSSTPVKIEGDENIISHIEIKRVGDQLDVGMEKGFNYKPSSTIKIYLTSPKFESIDVSGAAKIKTTNRLTSDDKLSIATSGAGDLDLDISVAKFSADISGAGSIKLKGKAIEGDISISGAGSAYCYDLHAENMAVDIAGVGSAEVSASKTLNAQLSGAGSISYKGSAIVTKDISGVGSIKKVD